MATPEKPQEKPLVDGFKIKAVSTKPLRALSDILSTVSFLEIALEKEAVNAAYIESKDINNDPYLFLIMRFGLNELEVIYSVPTDISPLKRKMDVIRYLLNILSLAGNNYSVDNKIIYQIIEDTLKSLSDSVSLDYSKLYSTYDSLKGEVDGLRKKNERLRDEVKALSNRNFELKAQNDEVLLLLKDIETLSDEALLARIQEWIVEHNGEINIYEFSKVNKVIETRVESVLNRLISEGYLELLR